MGGIAVLGLLSLWMEPAPVFAGADAAATGDGATWPEPGREGDAAGSLTDAIKAFRAASFADVLG